MYEWLCSGGPTYICRALAPESSATWVGSAVAALAIYFALKTWLASVSAIRSAYRPVLRPIAASKGNVDAQLILKNYGRGPAMAVILFDEAQGRWFGGIDVLEPLGPREGRDEKTRVGREVLQLRLAMENNQRYRVLYQDLGGRWHETEFVYLTAKNDKPAYINLVKYLGTRRSGWWRPQVPQVATSYFAHVISTED